MEQSRISDVGEKQSRVSSIIRGGAIWRASDNQNEEEQMVSKQSILQSEQSRTDGVKTEHPTNQSKADGVKAEHPTNQSGADGVKAEEMVSKQTSDK